MVKASPSFSFGLVFASRQEILCDLGVRAPQRQHLGDGVLCSLGFTCSLRLDRVFKKAHAHFEAWGFGFLVIAFARVFPVCIFGCSCVCLTLILFVYAWPICIPFNRISAWAWCIGVCLNCHIRVCLCLCIRVSLLVCWCFALANVCLSVCGRCFPRPSRTCLRAGGAQ